MLLSKTHYEIIPNRDSSHRMLEPFRKVHLHSRLCSILFQFRFRAMIIKSMAFVNSLSLTHSQPLYIILCTVTDSSACLRKNMANRWKLLRPPFQKKIPTDISINLASNAMYICHSLVMQSIRYSIRKLLFYQPPL